MANLSVPSEGLVSRILSEVGFEERIIGYRLRERTGPISITLYSFEEVVGLLNDTHPRIDFNRLEKWIREVMGDRELAGKIKKVIDEDGSDQERTFRIRNLMGERLLQCNARNIRHEI
jgi:hypothetical protein